VDDALLHWVTDTLLATHEPGLAAPARVVFLLHEYARTGRGDVRDAAEAGLTRALAGFPDLGHAFERCQWLGVFASARSFTDDERLGETVQHGLPGTIEAMEQAVRSVYEPGEGLFSRPLDEQVAAAAALVTGFELTGRLPYSMLAEELLQFARRGWWDAEVGALKGSFAVNCRASQLCARLALLHREPEYQSSAVVAHGADYADDAARMLAWAAAVHREHGGDAAEFGLAVVHGFALRAHPN